MTNRFNASFVQLAVLAASSLPGTVAAAMTYDDGGEHEVVDNMPGEDVVVTHRTTLNLSSNMGRGFELNSILANDASTLRVTGPGYVQGVDLDGINATFVGARDNRLSLRGGTAAAVGIRGTAGRYNFINVAIDGHSLNAPDAAAMLIEASAADINITQSSITSSWQAAKSPSASGVIVLKNYSGRLSLKDVDVKTEMLSDSPVIAFTSDQAQPALADLTIENMRAYATTGLLRTNGSASVAVKGSTIQSTGMVFHGSATPSNVHLSVEDTTLTSDPLSDGQSLIRIEKRAGNADVSYDVNIDNSRIQGIWAVQSDGVINLKNSSIDRPAPNAQQRALLFAGGNHTLNVTDNSQLRVGSAHTDNLLFYNVSNADDDVTRLNVENAVLQGSGVNAKGVVRVDMRQGAKWEGQIEGFTQVDLAPTSELNLTSSSSIDELVNGGSVSLAAGESVGTVLNVGHYTGQDGNLLLRAQLGDDSSPADKLVVSGDTEGTTHLTVLNAGGTGAQTLDGIELVHVGGASNGVFLQKGRLVAGAFDYRFEKRGNNWYLNSSLPEPTPEPQPEPKPEQNPEPAPEPQPQPQPEQTPDPQPQPESQPEAGTGPDRNAEDDSKLVPVPHPKPMPTPRPATHVVRPEAAAYVANQAASSMFLTSLRDRAGENRYANTIDDKGHASSLWLRQGGDHVRFQDSTGQIRTRGNTYVVQLGGDVAQLSRNGHDRLHLGAMAGYGNSHSRSRSHVSGHRAKGSVDGYSAGLYATWYQDAMQGTGAYVDGQVLYNWFDNHVSGDAIPRESYHSKGLITSAETGYTVAVGESRDADRTNRVLLEPYVGLTWMGVSNTRHTERNGTRVQAHGRGNVQSALGMRVYMQRHDEANTGVTRWLRPYAEISWLHNTKRNDVSLNGTRIAQAGAKDMAEIRLGIHAQLGAKASLWGSLGHRLGADSYGKTSATAGVSFRF